MTKHTAKSINLIFVWCYFESCFAIIFLKDNYLYFYAVFNTFAYASWIPDYPWRFPSSSTDSNVVKWLYVPDFKTKPNSSFLICMSTPLEHVTHGYATTGYRVVLCLVSSRWLHAAAVCLPPEASLWWREQGSSAPHGWRQCRDLPRPGRSVLQRP